MSATITTPLHRSVQPSQKKWLITSVALAVTGLILFFILYFSVETGGFLAQLDMPVHQWMAAHRNPILTTSMQFTTNILAPSTFAVITLVCAGAWAFIKKELWRPGLLIAAMSLTLASSTGLKLLIQRARPPAEMMVLPHEIDLSFPSGHTIGIAAALLVLGYLLYSRRQSLGLLITWILATLAGTLLIAITRLYLGYHWLTDVSASVSLAFIILAIVIAVDRLRPTKAA